MADDDIVAVLDRWLDYWRSPRGENEDLAIMARRARDEIVALRKQLDDALRREYASRQTQVLPGWTDALRQTRAEALEEAALVCERSGAGGCFSAARAIRALKEKP
jgi:hypothetical protein